jgi:hypothetical protein
LLALGLVLLGGSACWAGEIGAAQLPMDTLPPAAAAVRAPVTTPAPMAATSPAPAVSSAPVHVGSPCCDCGGAAPCCGCGHGPGHCHPDFPCARRFCDWLSYCPPKAPCHFGCCGCCGHKCTPCCMPPYMYFLDRCSCTLGYHTRPPVPHGPAPDGEEGPDTAGPAGPAGATGSSPGGTPTAAR